jgi:hypothetical protein
MIEKIGRRCKSRPKIYKLSCDGPDCNNFMMFEYFDDAKEYCSVKYKRSKWTTQSINGRSFYNYCPKCAKDINPFVIECLNCNKVVEFKTWDKMIDYKVNNGWGNKKVFIDNEKMWIYCCDECKPLLKLKKGIAWKSKPYE